ncbi:alpha/beta fold hydrolase [Candidatus Binatus sp.]|uniref:alpha/beta fold hydrolase n=2 Tax=Candidatus Binatus sp. TaxID=2811406 RepID=UPI003C58A2B1
MTKPISEAEMVSVGELSLAVRQWGTGETLLLVHGLGASSRLWINQVEFGDRFHVVAVDLRGFGLSGKPKSPGSYSIEKFSNDLFHLADKLGVSKFHYLGTSMGGFIGQAMALRSPQRITSLMLVHTAAKSSIPRDILEVRLKALKEMSMTDYGKLVAEQALAEGKQSRIFDWLVAMIAANDREAYARVLTEGLSGFDLSKESSRLQMPVLVIVGDTDRVIPPQAGYALAEGIQGVDLHTLKNAGHIGYAEQPAAFNEIILSFLGG